MKKIFAVVALLAVSLMFFTGCSGINYVDGSLEYQKGSSSLSGSFYINLSDEEVEYISFKLDIYGENNILLDSKKIGRQNVGVKDSNGYYKINFSYYYSDEIINNNAAISNIVVSDIKEWSYNMPIMVFVAVSVVSVVLILVIVFVFVGKRKDPDYEEYEDYADENSEE